MIKEIDYNIPELEKMKKYPETLYYIGNSKLLEKQKISIVGTRRPNSYTKEFTYKLASTLSSHDICIVSGAALGVDAIAHTASAKTNTIAVMANGLDTYYPSINKNLIKQIEEQGLVLSTYKKGEKAKKYTFVLRNELVVALGDILIITEADLNSGSLTSVDYALEMNKKIYVLPHRLNESLGTQKLIKEKKASIIYDIEEFISSFTKNKIIKKDDLVLRYCETNPIYEDALNKFGDKIFEYELEGKILIQNGKVYTKN